MTSSNGRGRTEVALSCLAALGGVLAFIVAFRFWRGDIGVPLVITNDAEAMLMFAKSIIDHGWVQQNPSLGAPFGQKMYDYPLGGDNLNFALMWVIARFTANPAAVVNGFFVLTFALVAAVAYACLRGLGVVRAFAMPLAIVYTLTPFHLARSENHLLLAGYYGIPLAVYLGVRAFRGELRIPSRHELRAWAGLGGAAVVLGSSGVYVCVFSVIVIVTLSLCGIFSNGWRSARPALLLVGAVVAIGVLNQSQSIIYHLQHGTNPVVAKRFPVESEAYALKLTGLLLPVPESPLDVGSLREDYGSPTNQTSVGASTEPLGVLGAVGLLVLFGVGIATLSGRPPTGRAFSPDLMPLAIAAFVCFVFATVGGASSVVALVVSPQIRAWDRMGLVLAFLAVASLGLVLGSLNRRLRGSADETVRRLLVCMAVGLLLVVPLFDQATAKYVPDYAANAAEWRSDASFVNAVVRRIGGKAAVLQLPYVAFPESPSPTPLVGPYSNARGYLHAPASVRWSYGAMRGRRTDIAAEMSRLSPAQIIASAVGAGFTTLWIDRLAYPDGAVGLEAGFRDVLGPPLIESGGGRYAVYSLASARRVLGPGDALRIAANDPLVVGPPAGLANATNTSAGLQGDSAGSLSFPVTNPSSHRRAVSLTGRVEGVRRQSVVVELDLGGRPAGRWRTRTHPFRFSRRVVLPPGSSTVTLSVLDATGTPTAFQLTGFQTPETTLAAAAATLADPVR